MEQFRLMVFEAVYSTGSYTKAARRLGITQPAVSQNIAELEKELGTELFTRTGPTPAAEVFIRLVRRVLKGYEDIRVLFNPDATTYGTVRIRADRSASEYALPRILSTLRASHPSVSFEVLPSENESGDADVVVSTVAIGQREGVSLHFEVSGPATPFVEAVRLILFSEQPVDFINGIGGLEV